MKWNLRIKLAVMASALLVASACGDTNSNTGLPDIDSSEPQPIPSIGQSSFVSADGYNGQATQDDGRNDASANNGAAPEADAGAEDDRTVEEGDIYRVTTTGHILNLNAYRGLQIIDFSDPSDPEIVGRVQVSGTPVEMYQVGNRVFMLLNNWHGYYGSRTDVMPAAYQGGLVMVVDISNPALPKVTGRAQVPGWIQSSRLTRGNNQEALFVVASDYNQTTSQQETVVKSFSVSSLGKLAPASQIGLGGYVTAIQATPDHLLVARHNWNRNNNTNNGSDVSVIDITNPNGTMIEGASVQVKGYVSNKFNMDVHENVLRVVSGNSWSGTGNTNHVETFQATDIQNLAPIDAATFGDGENLYATLFLGEKAFFVTYRRVDPFHAFEVALDGTITEKSEFIVSGWNDYFKPVEQQTRLIGIGKNDENGGNTMAVSLYDITNLSNPTPMITRDEIDLDWSWSEASWDDRAFSVLEKATSVTAPTGELETGLVLLPFTGYDQTNNTSVSAVQIFTFSKTTLTKRGLMNHDTPVRRSFIADRAASTTGNLSEMELSLYNTTNPDAPAHLGGVELAPSFTDFIVFGSHAVRRHDNRGYYWWSYSNSTVQPTDDLQIIEIAADPDQAEPLAEITIPSNASIEKVGNRLVVMAATPNATYDEWTTEVQVWDLTLPAMPTLIDTKTYTDLPQSGYYYDYWGWGPEGGDCFDCYYYYGGANNGTKVAGNAIVVPESHYEQDLVGTRHTRNIYPADGQQYWEKCGELRDQEGNTTASCTYYTGGINCSHLERLDGSKTSEVCNGDLYLCSVATDGEQNCDVVDAAQVPVQVNTYDYEEYRYWSWYSLHTLDVGGASLGDVDVIELSRDNEVSTVVAAGDSVFMSYKRPIRVAGDARPFVAYYVKEVDLSTASAPVLGREINVPGQLLSVEGNTLLTRDYLWGSTIIESSINKLEVQGNRALLKGVYRFTDRQVQNVILDGAGHALVSHRMAYLVNYDTYGRGEYEEWDQSVHLSILDLANPGLRSLSDTTVDDWANLQGAVTGRALFTVPGGMLVMKTDDPANPAIQSFFEMRGWPQATEISGRDVYFAAGVFGMVRFNLDAASNLMVTTTP